MNIRPASGPGSRGKQESHWQSWLLQVPERELGLEGKQDRLWLELGSADIDKFDRKLWRRLVPADIDGLAGNRLSSLWELEVGTDKQGWLKDILR